MAGKPNTAPRLAILPFEDLSGDPERAYFARGFVEDLIGEISRFKTLEVISSHSTRALAAEAAGEERRLDDLAAGYLLTGSIRPGRDRLRINARLADTRDGRVLWAERYDAPIGDVFRIQDDIASQVAVALTAQIDSERLSRARRMPVTQLEAYDCWLRGCEQLRRGSLAHDEEARRLFERAIEIDPGFARAHAGVSLSWFTSGAASSGSDGTRTSASPTRTRSGRSRWTRRITPST